MVDYNNDIKSILVHSPIVTKIAKHLNYISILSLCRAFPTLNIRDRIANKYINFREIVKRNLVKLIQCSGDSFNKIKDASRISEEILFAMERTETCMSGSFLLMCLIDDHCSPIFSVGDIDFFTNNYYKTYYSKRRKLASGEPYPQCSVSKFSNELYSSAIDIFDLEKNTSYDRVLHYGTARIDTTSQHDKLLYVRNFFINELKVQDVMVRKSFKVEDFISKTFDIDALKNMYNGKTLKIFNPISLLKKMSTVNIYSAYFKGFILACGYESCEYEDKSSYIDKQYERIQKYRDRGFDISIDYSKNLDENWELTKDIYPTFCKSEFDRYTQCWDHILLKAWLITFKK